VYFTFQFGCLAVHRYRDETWERAVRFHFPFSVLQPNWIRLTDHTPQ
jgi:hypothetical protein